MNLAIITKIFGTLLFSSAIVGIGTLIYLSNSGITKLNEDDSENIVIYAISETINSASQVESKSTSDEKTPTTKPSENKHNYECKFEGLLYECKISMPEDFDSENKQTNIDKLKKDKSESIEIKDELKKDKQIFKITINSSIGDWSKENSKIEIIPKNTNDENKDEKYALLRPLFALNAKNYNIDEYTKTEYFVVKTLTPAEKDIDSATNNDGDDSDTTISYKCLISETAISENPTMTDTCHIYKFSEQQETDKKWNKMVFQKPTEGTDDKTEDNKYYLVKLSEKQKIETVKHIKIKKNNSMWILLDTKIIPAVYDKDKDDNLFILDSPKSETTEDVIKTGEGASDPIANSESPEINTGSEEDSKTNDEKQPPKDVAGSTEESESSTTQNSDVPQK